jgi:hypothetical protein
MVHHALSRRFLSSLLAALIPAVGVASTSCASPRLPAGGYPLNAAGGGYELQVLVDGAPTGTFQHAGESFVMGRLGARYTLRVVNHTGRRVYAVVCVDGRDAIDGKTADVRTKRGYLVPAWGTVDIDGWRVSRAEAAAFRFTSVADSYAARTGSARDVGVIGVALFPEQHAPPRPVYVPQPYRREWGYRDDGADYLKGRGSMGASEGEAQADSPREKKSGGRAGEAPAAAPAPSAMADAESSGAPAPSRRPGLGTEFGESVSSPLREVAFARANATRPSVVLGVRYNDRDGLVALGIDVDGCCNDPDDLAWRQSATPFPGSDHRYATPPAGWRDGCCVRY